MLLHLGALVNSAARKKSFCIVVGDRHDLHIYDDVLTPDLWEPIQILKRSRLHGINTTPKGRRVYVQGCWSPKEVHIPFKEGILR